MFMCFFNKRFDDDDDVDQRLHVAETLVLLVHVHAQVGQKPPQRLFVQHAVAHEDEGEG